MALLSDFFNLGIKISRGNTLGLLDYVNCLFAVFWHNIPPFDPNGRGYNTAVTWAVVLVETQCEVVTRTSFFAH